MKNFDLFNDLRRCWFCFIIIAIGNKKPEQNVCTFWWAIIFKNSINIHYFHMVYQFLLLNTFSFSSRCFTYQLAFSLSWTLNLQSASVMFPNFCCSFFLRNFWILWMLVTVFKVKFTLWKTLIMYMALDR